ncbi:MAG: 50S ribosomal protein L21 [Bacillales bacterium]|jgi:large subunit ribosomal protein L21|nr:50S ribosomal protein L21 [Bacillales bacterium]
MYAIIETGGKQIKVSVGDKVFVEKLPTKVEGDDVVFDKVVLVGGETLKVGTPYVKNASVKAVVEKNGKGEKLTIFKYRSKHNENVKTGHRQPYTRVEIKEIVTKK